MNKMINKAISNIPPAAGRNFTGRFCLAGGRKKSRGYILSRRRQEKISRVDFISPAAGRNLAGRFCLAGGRTKFHTEICPANFPPYTAK
jgi:hypothetical protein